MKVLVVGGGGREHAIVWKLSQSSQITEILCAPGNPGIARLARCIPIPATDLEALADMARQENVDLTIIGPEDPLVQGIVDLFTERGLAVFGPTQAAAAIEGSKAFSKELMQKYGIPTAQYAVFTEHDAALQYCAGQTFPLVVKADGLALGKGVFICETYAQAEDALRQLMLSQSFGSSGQTVVIEEYLTGPEVSVLAFSDGKTIAPMASAKDHKRAYDGDSGPNTGGMGAISPNPHYVENENTADICMRTIFEPTVKAMATEGRPFVGVLYFGLMLTPEGPYVIEYNCRFGDPETQAVLPRMETDLLEVILACLQGRLSEVPLRFRAEACAAVVAASGGYPGAYEKGLPIDIKPIPGPDAYIFHAGTSTDSQGRIVTNGGRVLAASALGQNLPDAIANAYRALANIYFSGMEYRRDIGKS